MFGLGKSSGTHPSFFDIRINSYYKDLILVTGSHFESPSLMITGHIILSLPEPLNLKRVSLKLSGKYKLDFLEILEQSNSTLSNPVKEETTISEVCWDNLLINSTGIITIGTETPFPISEQSRPSLLSSASSSLNNSSTSLSTRRLIQPQSQTQLQFHQNGITGTPFADSQVSGKVSYVLPSGNYELPFKCILPGDIPETIEGLQAGSILYKFEANIDRVGFNKSTISKQKYFRIFRTLSSDSLSFNETISIGKSWPDKVQYEFSIPSRAVPIGGQTPINILLVPLCKGMKLGSIKAQIIQYYAFKGVSGDIYDDELCCLDVSMSEMEGKELNDKLSIDSCITIPSNLKKITPDCDFKQDFIKVRHKLKLQINLVMMNGNISELRANLPINLFISPDVAMTGRMIVLDKHGKIHFRKEQEPLFERRQVVRRNEPSINGSLVPGSGSPSTSTSTSTSTSGNGLITGDGIASTIVNSTGLTNFTQYGGLETVSAPPNYDQHVYDQILVGEQTVDPNSHIEIGEGDIHPPEDISEIPTYQHALESRDYSAVEEFAPVYN